MHIPISAYDINRENFLDKQYSSHDIESVESLQLSGFQYLVFQSLRFRPKIERMLRCNNNYDEGFNEKNRNHLIRERNKFRRVGILVGLSMQTVHYRKIAYNFDVSDVALFPLGKT